jgi:peptide/nickel transport system ATP-binding protein
MYLGRIIEEGPAREVVDSPRHPYTRALIAAVPRSDGAPRDRSLMPSGETPDPADVPAGCRFHPRCPVVASGEAARLGIEARCRGEDVVAVDVGSGRRVACHVVAG